MKTSTPAKLSTIPGAAAIATLIPTFLFPQELRVYVLFVAAFHVAIIGLPVFFAVRRRISWWISALAGLAIGGVPLGLIVGLEGWKAAATTFASMSALGVAAGLGFWLALRLTNPPSTNVHVSRVLQLLVIAAATIGIVQIFAFERSSRDQSCHNLFRNGGKSFIPTLVVELKVPASEWPQITQVFSSFGAAHTLQFRNSSRADANVRTLYLSLCNEAGAVISTSEQRWARAGFKPSGRTEGISIASYDGLPDSRSAELMRKFMSELEARWPGVAKITSGTAKTPGSAK